MEQKSRWEKEHYSFDDLREITAVLRSPEGQAVIAQAVWKELAKHK